MSEKEMELSETLSIAKSFVINNDEQNQKAADFLRGIKTIRKEIDIVSDPDIQKAFQLHRSLVAAKKKHTVVLDEAEQILKQKICAYMQEQERIRKEEQRRLEEEARKAEEARRLEEAMILEAQGQKEAAEQVFEEAVTVQAPVISMPKIVKPEGVSMRTSWKYEVIDEAAIPRAFLMIDHAKIGKIVTAMKSETKIPGVRVYEDNLLAAGGWR